MLLLPYIKYYLFLYIHVSMGVCNSEKTFKNEQRSRDAAAKKELIQVE